MSDKTMKEAIAELRGTSAEFELLELQAALQEVMLGAGRVAIGIREIAAEAHHLSAMPSTDLERRRALASYAATVSAAAEGQARALQELRRALDHWSI